MIKLALNLYGKATLGCSKVASALKVIFGGMCEKTPHQTTIRSWVIRHGCFNLNKPIEKSNDLVAIGDLTIGLGQVQCLAVLGVQMNKLEERKDYTLAHEDVVILDLHLTESSTGEFIHKSFETTWNKTGSDFIGAVIDQGSNIKKGLRLFQEQHPKTLIIHDIPHKMSLVVEHLLKGDIFWVAFIKKISETRKLIQQTEFASMMPPNQRSKARFMDISYYLEWPDRVEESKECGRLDFILEDRYQKYFGWFKEFETHRNDWKFIINALDMIKSTLREHGLSHDSYEYLKVYFEEVLSRIDDEKLKKTLEKALKAVEEESCKLLEGQVMLCSTEVLESIFGKFKELNRSSQGINGNVLGLATFVGPKLTEESVKEAMERCSAKTGMNWVKLKIGKTLGSLRHQCFRGKIKRTKFDSKNESAMVA